jgi:polyhydroxyalkanoate synthesis repressor PhaR
MEGRVIVKKYSNRRLYDTEGSRYVTLEELADKIRGGAEVRVVDAQSGDDLTQTTLAQIILESRGAARMLPVPLLVQLIRMGDDALAEFLGRYMSASLELYLQARQGAQAIAPWNPLANLPFAATSALARLFMGGAAGLGWAEPPPPPAPPPGAPQQASGSDIDDLRRELEELKRAVKGDTGRGGAKKRAK